MRFFHKPLTCTFVILLNYSQYALGTASGGPHAHLPVRICPTTSASPLAANLDLFRAVEVIERCSRALSV
jgi:hypothetical protein